MSRHDDQDATAYPPPPRPGFLPPMPPASGPAGGPADDPAYGPPGAAGPPAGSPAGPAWPAVPGRPSSPPPPVDVANSTPLAIMTIVSALVMLISAFLPWARASSSITLLGRSLGEDLGTVAGVDIDGTGQLIPVLALVALGAIAWGMLARNPRLCTYAAAPGALALLCCGIFLFRLDRAQQRLDFEPAGLDYTVTVGYGWFIALVSALILVGLSLAALITAPPATAAPQTVVPPPAGPQS